MAKPKTKTPALRSNRVIRKIRKNKTKQKAVKVNKLDVASRIREINDPCSMHIPPSLTTQAGCYPINQTVRLDFDQLLNYATMIFVTSAGGTGSVASIVSWDTVGAGAMTKLVHTLPLLSVAGSAGGASSSKASKVGIRLTNVTPNLYVSGRVYVANLSQRLTLPALPSSMTAAQWTTTMNEIKSLPEHMLRTYAGSEFTPSGRAYGKCISCHVVDEVDYNNFYPHNGTDTFDEFFSIFCQSTVAATTESNRPFSTTVIVIDKQSNTSTNFLQNYVYNIDAQMLTRWPINTVPGLGAKDVPAATPVLVNASREDASTAHARL